MYQSRFAMDATAGQVSRNRGLPVGQFCSAAATAVGEASDTGGRPRTSRTAYKQPMTNPISLLDFLPHRILANLPSHKYARWTPVLGPRDVFECDVGQMGFAPVFQSSKCASPFQVFRLPCLNERAIQSASGQSPWQQTTACVLLNKHYTVCITKCFIDDCAIS